MLCKKYNTYSEYSEGYEYNKLPPPEFNFIPHIHNIVLNFHKSIYSCG